MALPFIPALMQTVKKAIRSVDSTHAIFNIDSAWTDSDGHTDPRPWWLKW